jgi:hypothetical protein
MCVRCLIPVLYGAGYGINQQCNTVSLHYNPYSIQSAGSVHVIILIIIAFLENPCLTCLLILRHSITYD